MNNIFIKRLNGINYEKRNEPYILGRNTLLHPTFKMLTRRNSFYMYHSTFS